MFPLSEVPNYIRNCTCPLGKVLNTLEITFPLSKVQTQYARNGMFPLSKVLNLYVRKGTFPLSEVLNTLEMESFY